MKKLPSWLRKRKKLKDVPFVWTDQCQEAFETLKEKLVTAPVLVAPNWNKIFHVSVDTSLLATGAILSQLDDKKREHPIHYASRQLSKSEIKYSATERECLGMIFAVSKFRHYLLGKRFVFHVDHEALKYIVARPTRSGKLARWMLVLMEFTFTVEYRPGKLHGNVDFLSRLPGEPEELSLETSPKDNFLFIITEVTTEDDWINQFKFFLLTKEFPRGLPRNKISAFIFAAASFRLLNEDLYRVGRDLILRRCVAPEEVFSVVKACHTDPAGGHFNSKASIRKVYDTGYWWPTVTKDVHQFISACDECQRYGKPSQFHRMTLTPIMASQPFQRWAIDFMGPISPKAGYSQHEYILVAVDYVTKWAEVQSTRKNNADTVIRSLEDCIITRYGLPMAITSDNSTHFVNIAMKHVLSSYGITHNLITPYHPQANGQVERINRVLLSTIRKTVERNPKDWDKRLIGAVWAYRTTYKTTTGQSPFQLVYGQEAILPIEFMLPTLRVLTGYSDWPNSTDPDLTIKEREIPQFTTWFQNMAKNPVCQPGRLYNLLEAPPMIIDNLTHAGLQGLLLRKHLTYKPQYDDTIRALLDQTEVDRTQGTVRFRSQSGKLVPIHKMIIQKMFQFPAEGAKFPRNVEWKAMYAMLFLNTGFPSSGQVRMGALTWAPMMAIMKNWHVLLGRQNYLTNMTPVFDAVLWGNQFDWAAAVMDQLIVSISAYQKGSNSGKFTMTQVLMVILVGVRLWRKEDTKEVDTLQVPHSSTLPVFEQLYDNLMNLEISPFLDRELLGYIRPKLTEEQIVRILAQIDGVPSSRGLPEMAPMGSIEILEQLAGMNTRRTPEIEENPRTEGAETAPTVEGSKKRVKDQTGSSSKRQKIESSGDEALISRELRNKKLIQEKQVEAAAPVTIPAAEGSEPGKKKKSKKVIGIQEVVSRNEELREDQTQALEQLEELEKQPEGDTPGQGETYIVEQTVDVTPGDSIELVTQPGGRLEATLQVVAETTTITQTMSQLIQNNITGMDKAEFPPGSSTTPGENQERGLIEFGSPVRQAPGSPKEKDSPAKLIHSLRGRREVILHTLDQELRKQEREIQEELRRRNEVTPPEVIAELNVMEEEVKKLRKENQDWRTEYFKQEEVLRGVTTNNQRVINEWEKYSQELTEAIRAQINELWIQTVTLNDDRWKTRVAELKKEVDEAVSDHCEIQRLTKVYGLCLSFNQEVQQQEHKEATENLAKVTRERNEANETILKLQQELEDSRVDFDRQLHQKRQEYAKLQNQVTQEHAVREKEWQNRLETEKAKVTASLEESVKKLEEDHKKRIDTRIEEEGIRNKQYQDLITIMLQEIEGGSASSQYLKIRNSQQPEERSTVVSPWAEELQKATENLARLRQAERAKNRYWSRLEIKSKDNQRLAHLQQQANERVDTLADLMMENDMEIPPEDDTPVRRKEREITPDKSEGEEEVRTITRSIPPNLAEQAASIPESILEEQRRKSKVYLSTLTPITPVSNQNSFTTDRNPAVQDRSPVTLREIEVQTDMSLTPTALTPVFTNQELIKEEDPLGIKLTHQVPLTSSTTNTPPESAPGSKIPGQTSLVYTRKKSPQKKIPDTGKIHLVERRSEPGAEQSSQEPKVDSGDGHQGRHQLVTNKPEPSPDMERPKGLTIDKTRGRDLKISIPRDVDTPLTPKSKQGKEIIQEKPVHQDQVGNPQDPEDTVEGTSQSLPRAADDLVDQIYDLNRPEDQPTPTQPDGPVRVFKKKYKSPFNPTNISGTPLFVEIRDEDYYELSTVADLAEGYLEDERRKGVEVFLPFWPRPEFTHLMVGTVMKAVKRIMKHGPKSYSLEQLYQRDLAIFTMILAMKNKVDVGTPLTDEVFTQLWITGLGTGDNGNAFRGFLVEAFLRQDIDLEHPHGVTVITRNCIQKFAIMYHLHLLKEVTDNMKTPPNTAPTPPKVYYFHRICTREEMASLVEMERYQLAKAASDEDKREVKTLLQEVRKKWHELEEFTGMITGNWVNRVMDRWIHWNDVTPRMPEASLQDEIVRCCGPPEPKKIRRQRKKGDESSSDDDEPNDPNEDSFDYLDELEGQALGQALSRDKVEVKTVSLELPKVAKIMQLRVKDFAMPIAEALKVDQKFILRADRIPHVPSCIDLLTRFNGEYPTDMCLAWLALGRSPPAPMSIPSRDLVQSSFLPPMHLVPEYMLSLPIEGLIPRREGLTHAGYGKYPFQFPVMKIMMYTTPKQAIENLTTLIRDSANSLDVVIFRTNLYCRFLRTIFRAMERHHPGQEIDFSYDKPNSSHMIYYLIWTWLNLHSNLA
ncbi:hypothetical protein R1sor_006013 [Riccia sorocarpa]|uniref:Integrase catalytic domain-containing protein n=1 Tax=Riccia sorocarpa TaxID=122646 RepID=A0ABD3HP59_9MARC